MVVLLGNWVTGRCHPLLCQIAGKELELSRQFFKHPRGLKNKSRIFILCLKQCFAISNTPALNVTVCKATVTESPGLASGDLCALQCVLVGWACSYSNLVLNVNEATGSPAGYKESICCPR